MNMNPLEPEVKRRVLVYGDVDMNVIDGSSIWVTSLLKVLKMSGIDTIDLVLKKPLERDVVLGDILNDTTFRLIDPFQRFRDLLNSRTIRLATLSPDDAAVVLGALVNESKPSFVLVRGQKVNLALSSSEWAKDLLVPYVIWAQAKTPEEEKAVRSDNDRIAKNCARLLVQTERTKELLIENGVDPSKIFILPPMIPDGQEFGSFRNTSNRLVYTGQIKFAYNSLEMIEAIEELGIDHPSLHLDFVGDKVSKENATEEYLNAVKDRLENSRSVTWHRGLDRTSTMEIVAKGDVGLVWRKDSLDSVPEVSTKMLEYGIEGKPVIANRNPINESVLGKDYPLFANSYDEFKQKVLMALNDPDVYSSAAMTSYEMSSRFTFSEVGKNYLQPLLTTFPKGSTSPAKMTEGFDVNREMDRINSTLKELTLLVNRAKGSAPLDESVEETTISSLKRVKDLRIACILDEFSFNSLRPECNLLQLNPEDWKSEIEDFSPHILLVESAWAGTRRSWEYMVSRVSDEIRELTKYCKSSGIPTVFWNKEDPVHFERFLPTASLFEYVFTTDAACIPRYRAGLGSDSVFLLPFAAQPLVNNPIERMERKRGFNFAGSFYRNRHIERQSDFVNIMSTVEGLGLELTIYDRNFGSTDPIYEFPNRFQKYIVGSLPAERIEDAYKGWDFGINLNSIKYSPTMFARRVFELMASNTFVVGNYSLGVINLFGDLTASSDDPAEIKRRLEDLLSDDARLRKMKLVGLRKTLVEHTYEERLRYVVEKSLDKDLERNFAEVTVLTEASSQRDLESVIESYQRQCLGGTRMLVVCDLSLVRHLDDDRIKFVDSNSLKQELIKSEGANGWIAWFNPRDHYGSNYLLDLALATGYAGMDVVGKAAYHRSLGDRAKLENGHLRYRIVDGLDRRSAMVRWDSLKDLGPEALLELEGRISAPAFSIDEFNYCRDGTHPEVDDLPGIATGVSWHSLIDWSESIHSAIESDGVVRLAATAISKYTKKVPDLEVRKEGGSITIFSASQGTAHRMLYFEDDRLRNMLLGKNGCEVQLNGSVGFKFKMVIVFNDENRVKITHVDVPLNTVTRVDPVPGAKSVKMGFRIEGSGTGTIDSLNIYDWTRIDSASRELLEQPIVGVSRSSRRKIVFVGHDLKFINQIIERFRSNPDYEIRIDLWQGHNSHDPKWSKQCINWADIIVCEWALGNLAYYSKNKRDNQVLVARMHRQELTTRYHEQTKFERVDRMIFIAPHTMEQYIALTGLDPGKCVRIDNYIEGDRIMPSVYDPERAYSIGMVGMVPKLKNPKMAFEIFDRVWENDHRSRMLIKGKKPEELPWLAANKEEMQYYADLRLMIESAPWKDRVTYSPFGEDMGTFYGQVGFIISSSDLEGSHQSVGEALMAGSIPILRDWEGAGRVYPGLDLFHTVEEAAHMIIAAQSGFDSKIAELSDYRERFASEHSVESIYAQWLAMTDPLYKKMVRKRFECVSGATGI